MLILGNTPPLPHIKRFSFYVLKGARKLSAIDLNKPLGTLAGGTADAHEGIPSYVHFGSQHMFVNRFMCICRSALWISSVKT